MNILEKSLNYFQKIDINFDLYIIADTQEKTALLSKYISHADDSEFFSRKEFAEIASALFYIFGFAKVFYSELDFIEYVIKENPLPNECYVYNFSRDGVAQGKKSLIPSFCDLCGLHYTGSNAFTISLLRNKWFFMQILSNYGIEAPKTILCTKDTLKTAEDFIGDKILIKNVYESASQGVLSDNCMFVEKDYYGKIRKIMDRMRVKQILLQQYIDGPECEVLVIQFKHEYYALEPVEIIINENDFLDSYTSNSYNYSFQDLTNTVNSKVINQIKNTATKAAAVLEIKDYARFDFRIKGEQPYLIDIAGTPYTIKHSSIAYLFEKMMNLEYNDVYKVIMACCISNYNANQS